MKQCYTQNPTNALPLVSKPLNRWLAYSLSLIIVFLSLAMSAKGQNSLQFDGMNDQVIIPHHPSLNLTSEATYEAWIRWGGGYNLFMKGSYGLGYRY
ncbi:MAG: hypothetical protein EAZ06_08255 [Cytophagales bacterium]|nr:MAG: hypothetical protein EAZ06_08255 [Cytophagales bacterium]